MRKSTLSALFGILLLTVLPCQAQETSLYVLVLDNLSTDSTYFKVSHYPKVTTSGEEFTVSVGDSAQVSFAMSSCYFKIVIKADNDVEPITDSIEEQSEGATFSMDTAHYRGLRPGSQVSIYSSDGQLLDTTTADGQGHATVDMSRLPSGKVYILRSEKKSIKMIK